VTVEHKPKLTRAQLEQELADAIRSRDEAQADRAALLGELRRLAQVLNRTGVQAGDMAGHVTTIVSRYS
jgi:ABC-type phosphate transport system auxiliary subunit